MKILKCDICGSDKDVRELRLPVYKLRESCDGLTYYDYEHPKVYMKELDICYDCLMKCTNICDDTVMGYGPIYIQQNPELNTRKEE